jgi:hypothetical protein
MFDPDIGVVFDVLPDEFDEVLLDDEAFVSNAADDAGDQHDVVLLLLAVFGIEDDLHYLLGNAEEFYAFVHEAFLEEGRELFDLVEFPIGCFL